MPSIISSLALLQTLFPNSVVIDRRALAAALGFSVKTLENQGDRFPIPCVRLGRNTRYRLADVAAFLDNSLGVSSETPAARPVDLPVKRKPGRPPKRAAVGGAS